MKDFLSSNIKYLRTKKGKSQAGLGSELKKAHTSIGNWEKGIAQPSLAEIGEIARIFDIHPSDLIYTDLSQGKDSAKGESTKNVQKGKDAGQDLGGYSMVTDESSPTYDSKSKAGLKEHESSFKPAEKGEYNGLLGEILAELKLWRNAKENPAVSLANLEELHGQLQAETALRTGLQNLTLEYLTGLVNKDLQTLYLELGNKVAEHLKLPPVERKKSVTDTVGK